MATVMGTMQLRMVRWFPKMAFGWQRRHEPRRGRKHLMVRFREEHRKQRDKCTKALHSSARVKSPLSTPMGRQAVMTSSARGARGAATSMDCRRRVLGVELQGLMRDFSRAPGGRTWTVRCLPALRRRRQEEAEGEGLGGDGAWPSGHGEQGKGRGEPGRRRHRPSGRRRGQGWQRPWRVTGGARAGAARASEARQGEGRRKASLPSGGAEGRARPRAGLGDRVRPGGGSGRS